MEAPKIVFTIAKATTPPSAPVDCVNDDDDGNDDEKDNGKDNSDYDNNEDKNPT